MKGSMDSEREGGGDPGGEPKWYDEPLPEGFEEAHEAYYGDRGIEPEDLAYDDDFFDDDDRDDDDYFFDEDE